MLPEQSALLSPLTLCGESQGKRKGAWGRAKLVLLGNGIAASTNLEFPDLSANCHVQDLAKMFQLLWHIYTVGASVRF